MKFITREEAHKKTQRINRQTHSEGRPKEIVYYKSAANRDYRLIADLILQGIGTFRDAILIYEFSLVRDGWPSPSDARWKAYYEWRGECGDERGIHEAPVHVASDDDRFRLKELIVFAFQLGWDCKLAANPSRSLVLMSHDDRVEFYRAQSMRTVASKMRAQG